MITKEQLAKENYAIKNEIEAWSKKDETLRKKFAKVLNRMESDRFSGSYKTPSDLSWEEIFCEIGKLTCYHDFRQWKENIEFRLDSFKSQLQGKSPIEE